MHDRRPPLLLLHGDDEPPRPDKLRGRRGLGPVAGVDLDAAVGGF
jgi:hypothetical protein